MHVCTNDVRQRGSQEMLGLKRLQGWVEVVTMLRSVRPCMPQNMLSDVPKEGDSAALAAYSAAACKSIRQSLAWCA